MFEIKINNLFMLLLVLLFTYLANSQWVQEEQDTCSTPNNLPGDCVVIMSCAPLISQLQNAPRPIPPAIVQLLQRSRCGFEGSQPKVCCPREMATSKPPTQFYSEPPPDVTRHRNMGLLRNDICGANLEDRIINGNKTGVFEFPWMALIAYNTNAGLSFRCGGTLIADKYVLSAAHCITNLGARLTLAGVRLGEHNIKTDPDCEKISADGEVICAPPVQDFSIEKIIPHPQYNSVMLTNDIGLIRLGGMANYSADTVRPICLPVSPELQNTDFTKKSVIVTGWGATELGTTSPDLLKVELPVITNIQCGTVYNKSAPIGFKQMCAGGVAGRDSCGGDSGGPLQYFGTLSKSLRYIQHGIVSFGPKRCGTENQPGVYTKVAYYIDWILDQLKP